jgi:hypothetical protein
LDESVLLAIYLQMKRGCTIKLVQPLGFQCDPDRNIEDFIYLFASYFNHLFFSILQVKLKIGLLRLS